MSFLNQKKIFKVFFYSIFGLTIFTGVFGITFEVMDCFLPNRGMIEIDKTLLVITFIIAIIIFALDNLIPIYGSKYFGATKYGILGASLGLIIGIVSPIPFGILIGPIFGALIGELLFNNDLKKSIKSSIGVLIGFLASSLIKFVTCIVYLMIYLMQFWEYIN